MVADIQVFGSLTLKKESKHKPLHHKQLQSTAALNACWHGVCNLIVAMVADLKQFDELNVLAIRSQWDWPGALRDIFRPRGINLLVAERPNDIVNVLRQRRICTTIIDTDPGEPETGLWTLKIIRMEQPLMPCILLARCATNMMLEKALQLDVFSVIDKPVNMNILRDQLNRLFVKRYGSNIFSS